MGFGLPTLIMLKPRVFLGADNHGDWRRLFRRAAGAGPEDFSGNLHFSAAGAFHRGKAERDAAEVVGGGVFRLAILLNGAEEFAHGPGHAVRKPCAFQRRVGFPFGGDHPGIVGRADRSGSLLEALGAGDEQVFEVAGHGVRTEGHGGLAVFEGDRR